MGCCQRGSRGTGRSGRNSRPVVVGGGHCNIIIVDGVTRQRYDCNAHPPAGQRSASPETGRQGRPKSRQSPATGQGRGGYFGRVGPSEYGRRRGAGQRWTPTPLSRGTRRHPSGAPTGGIAAVLRRPRLAPGDDPRNRLRRDAACHHPAGYHPRGRPSASSPSGCRRHRPLPCPRLCGNVHPQSLAIGGLRGGAPLPGEFVGMCSDGSG